MMLKPLTAAVALALAAGVAAQQVCNGRPEYCSRIYSNITQVASHDSAFVGYLPTQNQHSSLTDQMNLGIRFLQGQTHVKNGALEMCHTTCFEEDAGSTVSYLSTIKSFLDANPNEVITVLLTNGDNVDVGMFDSALTAANLQSYLFQPSTGSGVLSIGDWPTLGELISAGQRLVFFLDYGADTTRFPHILNEFAYFWETPFDTTDMNFPECTLDRGAPAAGKMYIVNHFLDMSIFGIDVPNVALAGRTNAVSGDGSIGAQASLCEGLYGQAPKGVLLDYVDIGDPLGAQLALNGLS